MNFFEQQDRARRISGRLVVLFVIAVAFIIVVTYVVTAAALGGVESRVQGGGTISWLRPGLLALVSLGVSGLVLSASAIKTVSLRQGGSAVAEMMNGRLVHRLSSRPEEKRLLNVVEEMAIASGVPVPAVYVMDKEQGINAFAAGFGPEDAVIAVTAGTLSTMTRDELQGIIAHEFSHILNKDVRLNMQLTGLIFGILAIAIAGRFLVRVVGFRGSSNEKGFSVGLAAFAAGMALLITGYLGVFFGRLIKQAVSRQREYLADASAVQFTRNPDGIGNALKKIGGWTDGSRISSASGEEIAHFFFADGLSANFAARLLSTHPPLAERITRIDPSFDGAFLPTPAIASTLGSEIPEATSGFAASDVVETPPESVVDRVGTTSRDHLRLDDVIHLEIPEGVRRAVTIPFSAVSVVYALLLDNDKDIRKAQLALLRSELSKPILVETIKWSDEIALLDPHAKLPLVDLASPALRQLSQSQYERFAAVLDALISADQHLTLFEFALKKIVEHRLRIVYERRPRRQVTNIRTIRADVAVLLAAVSGAGNDDLQSVQSTYAAARMRLPVDIEIPETPVPVSATLLGNAIDRLALAKPAVKQSAVDACAHAVLQDRHVTLKEAELLRAVVVALDCPLPPFLPTPVNHRKRGDE